MVFKNDWVTTSVTFAFAPGKDSNNLNVCESHKSVFTTMKFIDTTTKIITNSGKTIENSNEFPESKTTSRNFEMTKKLQQQRKFWNTTN